MKNLLRILTPFAFAAATSATAYADDFTATAVSLGSKVSIDLVACGAQADSYRVTLPASGSVILPCSLAQLRADAGLAALITAGRVRVDLSGAVPAETHYYSVSAGGDLDTTLESSFPYSARFISVLAEVTATGGTTAVIEDETDALSGTIDTSAAAVSQVLSADMTLSISKGDPLVLARTNTDAAVLLIVTFVPTSL